MTLGPAEVLSEAEVRAVLETFSCAPTAIRNRALITLLWRAGLRVSEALDLKLDDLHLGERPVLRVRAGKTPSAVRTIGLHPDVVSELERWLAARPPLGPYVFCTLAGARVSTSYVRHMLIRKRRQAGIERRVHPHAFRATLAVELVREGVSVPAVRDVLGHSSIAQTDAYLRRVFPQDAVDAVVNRRAA